MRSASHLLRDVRIAEGLSQAQLAARAGTTQSAISRIESGRTSPSVASLDRLLRLMGHSLAAEARPIEDGVDRSLIRANLALEPEERVRQGLDLADFVRRNRGAVARG